MRHRVFGRKLGRTKDQRRALFRNLTSELILHGRVKTTIAKAKAARPFIEKLVTKARKVQNQLSYRREILRILPKDKALILVKDIAPRFTERTSGFLRIVRLAARRGDDAQMAILEWTEQGEIKNKQRLRSEELEKVKSKNEKPATTEAQRKTETQKKPRRKRSVSQKHS